MNALSWAMRGLLLLVFIFVVIPTVVVVAMILAGSNKLAVSAAVDKAAAKELGPAKGPAKEGFRQGFQQAISMANSSNTALALIDCCIKASYQTAYDGSGVSLAQIRAVVARGARWVDFDVISVDAQPVVAYTTAPVAAAPAAPAAPDAASASSSVGDPPAPASTLPLPSVLNELATVAFNSATAPNAGDPLFVCLRVKSNDAAIYATVAAAAGNAFGSALHASRIQPHAVPLSALLGRVVLVLDVRNSAAAFASRCDNALPACAAVKQIRSLAGLLAGTDAFPLTTADIQAQIAYSPVMGVDPGAQIARTAALSRATPAVDTRTAPAVAAPAVAPAAPTMPRDSSATRLRCTLPALQSPANGDYSDLVQRWGIQVAPQCFWIDDGALAKYEAFFQDNGASAFLSLASAVMLR